MRRIAVVAAAVAMGFVSSVVGVPQSPAAASHVPADCTVTIHAGARNATLTCTNRPAGQQWRMEALCWAFGPESSIQGNVVTGSGSSTGTRNCTSGIILQHNFVAFVEVDG